jgi:spermidine synthase
MTFLIYILMSLALTLIVSRVALEYLPSLINAVAGPGNIESNNVTKYFLISIIIAPPTLLFGAVFSLCLELICSNDSKQPRLVGRVYAINTLGSILGVVLTGLWVIPTWNSDSSLVFGVFLILLTPFFILKHSGLAPRFISAVVTVIVLANILMPHLDYKHIISSSLYFFDRTKTFREPSYKFVKEGRNGVVSVSSYDEKLFLLKKNNLTEAAIYPPDMFAWRAETLLSLLPYFLSEKPINAFIVGLGAGSTLTAATLTKFRSIDVIELDPLIEQANHYLYPDGIAALRNPKVNYHIDDARHRLLLQNKRYDAIISQPSHPWLSGSSNLFTKEYFQIIKSRLNEGGIYSQWLNLFNLDATTLKSIFRAMYDVFPHGMNFTVRDDGSMILLASNQPIVFNLSRISERMREPTIANVLAKWNINTAHDLLTFFSLSREEANKVAISSQPNTDDNLMTEVRLAKLNEFPIGDENPLALLTKNFKFDIVRYLPMENREVAISQISDYFARKGDRFRQMRLQKQLHDLR